MTMMGKSSTWSLLGALLCLSLFDSTTSFSTAPFLSSVTVTRAATPPSVVSSSLPRAVVVHPSVVPLQSAMTSQSDMPTSVEALPEKTASSAEAEEVDSKKSLLNRIKSYYAPKNDGLTFRQRLAKMGLASVLSYGWISNVNASLFVSLAWYAFSKRSGMSPLAPGQWKGFLAVYAGFYLISNIVRPLRLAAAVAISPKFDQLVSYIQRRLQIPRGAAIGVTVFSANLVGTCVIMASGICLASLAAGVPVFPLKI